MKKQLSKLFQLPKLEPRLLWESYLLLSLIRLGLWLLPFGKLQKLLGRMRSLSKSSLNVQIKQIITAVNRASRYSPGNVKCLARALTTELLLNKYGYSPKLQIGVTKGEEGNLEAHAWVEEQERIVIGYLQDLDKFTILTSLK